MNILIVDHFNRHGGAQEYAVDIAEELNNQGHACYLSRVDHPILSNSSFAIEKICEVDCSLKSLLLKRGKILTAIKSKGIDVIHCNSIPALIFIRLLFSNIPVLFTAHDSYLPKYKEFIVKKIVNSIIAVSQSVMDYYVKSGYGKSIVVIYNGLKDFTVPLNDTSAVSVAVIGRVERTKGVDLFINSANLLKEEYTNVKFLIIGDGEDTEYREELEVIAQGNSNIEFLPFRNSKETLFNGIDVVVNCSTYSEPLGRTLIEAGIVSLPVIGPDQGGPLEIIDDGKSGLIFKSGDYRSLADKLKLLIEDPSLRMKMGKYGRKIFLNKFRIDVITRQIVDLYRQFLAN